MSRAFVWESASEQYALRQGDDGISDYPITLTAWVRTAATESQTALVLLAQSNPDDIKQRMTFSVGGRAFAASEAISTAQRSAVSTTTGADDVWHHIAAVYTSAALRAAFLNGGGKGTDTFSVPWSNYNEIRVGRNSTGGYSNGDTYWPAIHTVALSDAEVLALANGARPDTIQAASLYGWWSYTGQDLSGNDRHLTLVNNPGNTTDTPSQTDTFGESQPPFVSGITNPRSSVTTADIVVPETFPDTKEHLRRIAVGANAALDGKLRNTGEVTLDANSATTTLSDERIGIDSEIIFSPKTANAAAEEPYVSALAEKSATITHTNNAQADRTYGYAILG